MNAVTSETGEEDFSISDPDFDLNDQLNNSERQSLISSTSHKSSFSSRFLHWLSLMRFARHTLGIVFLLVTVLLFTTSNFLASVSFPATTHDHIIDWSRLYFPIIHTPNHISSLTSTLRFFPSSSSCLLSGDYGPFVDPFDEPFQASRNPSTSLL